VTGRAAHAILLSVLLIGGAALRLWGLRFGLPHPMTRPDEEFIVSMALRFFSGDYNPHFFEWPSLYFYVVHAVFRVMYAAGHLAGRFPDVDSFVRMTVAEPGSAHIALRVMSVVAAVATMAVVHGLARALFGSSAGLAAAALLAASYLHVRDSHFGVLDVPLTLVIVTSVRLLAKGVSTPRPLPWFALAGLAGGLATSIKYNAAALVVAGVAAAAYRLSRPASRARRDDVVALTAFVTAFGLGFLAGSPYVVLDVEAFRAGLAAQVVRLTEGHGFRADEVWLYHLTFSLRYGVGPVVLAASAAGLVLLMLRDWRMAMLLAAFPVSYFVVIGSGHTAFIRYTTPLVPFVCVLAAYGIHGIVGTLTSSLGERLRTAAMTAAVGVAALPPLLTSIQFDRLLTRQDTRVLAADWMRSRVKAGELVFQSGASYARPLFAWRIERERPRTLEFDPRRAAFVDGGREVQPSWVVVAESPLRLYTPVPPELRSILSAGYALQQTFDPVREPEPEAAFDRHDAFFLPYADFSARERPGPALSIYRRR
jgi:Dolichyl-phosphate-mannose-protein mannosyltransferase